MRKNPRLIGDQHVKSVCTGIQNYLNNESLDDFPKTVIQTVEFITASYPDIKSVVSKFDSEFPDQEHDITLYTGSKEKIDVNLFLIKKGGRIQPKNPGAKSFLSKYFLSVKSQNIFNESLEKNHLAFLREILKLKYGTHYISDKRELKKLVSELYPKFSDEINQYRNKLLYSLRETCFNILKDFYNDREEGFFNAYNVFFMTGNVNLITYYNNNDKDIIVEEFNPGTPSFKDIQIYKIGKNTVGVRYGNVALTLRFKFESGPISSIKLAASYDSFPNAVEYEPKNISTMQKVSDLINNHQYTLTSNNSNAIGKCHEAISYYYFLKEFPHISQVEPDDCVYLLSNYYSLVKPDILNKIFVATSTLVPVVKEKLHKRYSNFKIESIELIPENYLNDRLDTGDLQLIIRVDDNYVVENISLKALARKSSKITTKNPGIGTILGSTYFSIGSLDNIVKEVKSKFQIGAINHKESLEILAKELGLQLNLATQEQLKQGVENLLGKAIMAVTYYEENISHCKEHSKLDSRINVYPQKPTSIQNTLAWNNDLEAISLRVKFSRGQKYGWSTIKLTSEYKLK